MLEESQVNPFSPFNGPIKKFFPDLEDFLVFQRSVEKMEVGEYPLRDEYIVTLPFVYKGFSYIKGQKIKLTLEEAITYNGMVKKDDDSFKEKTLKFISAYQDFFETAKTCYQKNPYKCIYTREVKGQLYLVVRNE